MSKFMLSAFALTGLLFGGATLAAEETPAAPAAEAKEVKPIGGTVVSFADNKLVLKVRNRETKEEKDQTFTTDEKTVVSIDGDDKKALTDITVGQRVRVTATGDLATRIESRTKRPEGAPKQ